MLVLLIKLNQFSFGHLHVEHSLHRIISFNGWWSRERGWEWWIWSVVRILWLLKRIYGVNYHLDWFVVKGHSSQVNTRYCDLHLWRYWIHYWTWNDVNCLWSVVRIRMCCWKGLVIETKIRTVISSGKRPNPSDLGS